MSLNKDWLAPAVIIEEAVVAVQPLFVARGLYLKLNLPQNLPLIPGDRTRIRQVLLNLLSNAGCFSEKGGVPLRLGLSRVNSA